MPEASSFGFLNLFPLFTKGFYLLHTFECRVIFIATQFQQEYHCTLKSCGLS